MWTTSNAFWGEVDMPRSLRWDICISHRGTESEQFIADYFQNGRKVLLIAGAGFDPRTTAIIARLSAAGAAVGVLLIQENRPGADQELVRRATENCSQIQALITDSQTLPIEIFGQDGAVVGGRRVVDVIHKQKFADVTDVVVDTSALSVGTSYPVIRYLVERYEKTKDLKNLHVFVSHDPILDAAIQSIAGDAPGYIHGFRGGSSLDSLAGAAKLWLPHLAFGRRSTLTRLYNFVDPHDTCPILPFPARNPRTGDEIAEEYLVEFEGAWPVDARNIVYAAEDDPLDLYRTILRLDDLRRPVFAEVGGSQLVLSPVGSKVMALGALMAALERDLPVAYLESIGYSVDPSVPKVSDSAYFIHLWLEGEAYSRPRAPLQIGRTSS